VETHVGDELDARQDQGIHDVAFIESVKWKREAASVRKLEPLAPKLRGPSGWRDVARRKATVNENGHRSRADSCTSPEPDRTADLREQAGASQHAPLVKHSFPWPARAHPLA
jgi:hypothetical protein